MKKTKDIVWGIVLILVAAYLIVSKLGVMPSIPVFAVAFTILFVYIAINGIIKRNFFEFFAPIGCIVWIFDDEIEKLSGLEVTKLTPWVVFVVVILLTIAFEIMFRGKKKHTKSKEVNFGDNVGEEFVTDGQTDISGNFHGTTKYISGEIDHVNIESNFGKMVAYFDNAIIKNGKAVVDIENNFGSTEVYIPKTWRVSITQDASFGNVRIHGSGNNDADAPLLVINAETNFGEVGIFFI